MAGRARSSSSPTKAPATPDLTLDAAFDRVWALLDAAVSDRTAALRQLVVATGGDTGPDARTMVLRHSDRAMSTLNFYSDLRAGKIDVLRTLPRVAIVGYDPLSAIQLRLHGAACIIRSGPVVERSWQATADTARRSYMTVAPPGTRLDAPGDGLAALAGTSGRSNFALIAVVLDRLEWLCLDPSGHRRASHTASPAGWSGSWLVP